MPVAEPMSTANVAMVSRKEHGSTAALLGSPLHDVPKEKLSWVGWLLYVSALNSLRRAQRSHSSVLARTRDEGAYRQWRSNQLAGQLRAHFNLNKLAGKQVLDFACGTGELGFLLLGAAPASVTGVDISAQAIAKANHSKAHMGPAEAANLAFVCQKEGDPAPVPAESVDVLCCFDALEHISNLASVLADWRRMLRPGGHVWVWWSPWRGPFGHHLDSLMPLPWVHLFFAERTIFSVCAKLYDHPAFVPRLWDVDSETGRKKPNKWRSTRSFAPFLNRLTRRAFEHELRKVGLDILRRETHGFSGSRVSRMTRVLLPWPIIGDGFVSYYVYELEKPVRS